MPVSAAARRRPDSAIPEVSPLDLRRLTAIRTADALLAIARCASKVAAGRPILEHEDLELAAAVAFFDTPGGWSAAADALITRAFDRVRAAGFELRPADVDRLERIAARAHRELTRLDERKAPIPLDRGAAA